MQKTAISVVLLASFALAARSQTSDRSLIGMWSGYWVTRIAEEQTKRPISVYLAEDGTATLEGSQRHDGSWQYAKNVLTLVMPTLNESAISIDIKLDDPDRLHGNVSFPSDPLEVTTSVDLERGQAAARPSAVANKVHFSPLCRSALSSKVISLFEMYDLDCPLTRAAFDGFPVRVNALLDDLIFTLFGRRLKLLVSNREILIEQFGWPLPDKTDTLIEQALSSVVDKHYIVEIGLLPDTKSPWHPLGPPHGGSSGHGAYSIRTFSLQDLKPEFKNSFRHTKCQLCDPEATTDTIDELWAQLLRVAQGFGLRLSKAADEKYKAASLGELRSHDSTGFVYEDVTIWLNPIQNAFGGWSFQFDVSSGIWFRRAADAPAKRISEECSPAIENYYKVKCRDTDIINAFFDSVLDPNMRSRWR
jgi:hypothetical protein